MISKNIINADTVNIGYINFKNRIINGDFQVWQRGEDITISKQNGYIGVDRFITWQTGEDSNGNTTGAVCDIENKKEYDGQDIVSSYYISNTDTTVTNTKFGVTQRVEPLNYWDLINKKITISFWIKTNKTNINLYTQHDYIDSNGNEIGESIYSEDISIQSDTWTKIERTITLSSANYTTIDDEVSTELFAVSISNIADNDYIQLKQVQVEEGDIATEFEKIPYDLQLQRCMRYYEWFHIDYTSYDNANASNYTSTIFFKTQKRTLPSITCVYAYDESTTQQLNSYSIDTITTQNARIYNHSAASGWGDNKHMHFAGTIDAEL